MNQPEGAERLAIERDRDLAWELFDAQPQHPRIPELAQSVLARAPQFTGMIILLSMHKQACGDVDEARQLLQQLMGRRDRQYINALRRLRDLEFSDENYAESLRLAELVLREDPEADWLDRMELASGTAVVEDPETGWGLLDEAVALCGRTDPDHYAGALAQRALRFLALGVPPERFLVAAEQAIEADPSEAVLSTALAYAYLYDYRPGEAELLLGRVLREDPTEEVAQGGMMIARAFLEVLDHPDHTIDDLRSAGMGEVAWRTLRDKWYGIGLEEALDALDSVMPDELAASLRPPLDGGIGRSSSSGGQLLGWHDGQAPGSGALWGDGNSFRLMTSHEIQEMDEAMQQHPEAWLQWGDGTPDYFSQIFTDDAGEYVIEGPGGRLLLRGPRGLDRELAPSLADWLWDRVVAFGGDDPRPGARKSAERKERDV